MRIRFAFLPTFFIVLAILFAIAVFVRIRSMTIESRTEQREPITPTEPMDTQPAPVVIAPVVEQPRMPEPERPPATAPPRWIVQPVPTPPREPEPAPVVSTTGVPRPERPAEQRPPVVAAPAPTTPRPRPPQPPAPVPQPQPPVPDTSGGPPYPPPESDRDESSDSAAPQLLSIGFTPVEVRDGEETQLGIEAVDDLSGVKSISGTLLAPSGALQGFATQRVGDTNRYVSRILIPKEAAEGLWRVNHLSLVDRASNGRALAGASLPPTASFRVISSTPDSQGPSLKAVWVERRSMRSGEKNVVYVQAEDDRSGVGLVTGVFQSPSRLARMGFACRSAAAGTWECDFNSPVCADCGDWRLEQVQMQDKANNMTVARGDHPAVAAVSIDITSPQCDSTPPEVMALTLDKRVVGAPSVIIVSATLSEDACGVLTVSAQVLGPANVEGTPRLTFSFTQGEQPQIWVGRLEIPALAAKGTWRMASLQVLDRGRNLRTYSQNDHVLSGAQFLVQ